MKGQTFTSTVPTAYEETHPGDTSRIYVIPPALLERHVREDQYSAQGQL